MVAREEDLPAWFREEVNRRAGEDKVHEAAHDGRRWLACAVAMLAVDGATWAFATQADNAFKSEEVQRPLIRLDPRAPVPKDLTNSALPEPLMSTRPDLVKYAVPMGANAIYVALGLYLLIAEAFGHGLDWFGSGPLDPVVAKRNGSLVAIVMPCRGPDAEETEQGLDAARKLRGLRGAT